jgi:hypothetical protein
MRSWVGSRGKTTDDFQLAVEKRRHAPIKKLPSQTPCPPCDVFFFDLPGRPGGTIGGLFATSKQHRGQDRRPASKSLGLGSTRVKSSAVSSCSSCSKAGRQTVGW